MTVKRIRGAAPAARILVVLLAASLGLSSCVSTPGDAGPVDPATLSEGQRLALVKKYLEQGHDALAGERVGEALDAFDRVIALEPESAEAWAGRAWCYGHWTVQLRERASEAFRRAIELEPSDPAYRTAFAEYLLGENLLEDLEPVLAGAERLMPHDPYLALLYTRYWMGRRVLDEALAWADKSIAADARGGWAYLYRAEILRMAGGRDREARTDFDRALSAFERSGDEGGVENVKARLLELGW